MPNPFSLTKLAETIEKFAENILKIYTQMYQNRNKLKKSSISIISSCHSLPLFDFRLKAIIWKNFGFFLLPFFSSTGLLLTKNILIDWCFCFFTSACWNLSIQYLTLKYNWVQPTPQKFDKDSCKPFTIQGARNPNPLSPSTTRDALLAVMLVHKEAEGNSLPPKTPCNSF